MRTMHRRRFAWIASLGLTAAAGVVAHTVAYRLAAPSGHHQHFLERTGHGYLAHWRLCLAVCLAVVLVALAAYAAEGFRRRRRAMPPVWLFGLLPPLGFAVQEHLERLLHAGSFPFAAVVEPVFLVGLVLQLPFALAAFLAARLLLTVADALAGRWRRRASVALSAPALPWRPAVAVETPRVGVLALGHGQRAPPFLRPR